MATSAEARAALRTTRYAALILDLGLPDGDGLSILREIRHRKDPLPVLVLTARGGVHDRVSGLRSGADDYLVKPFDFEELLARLEALLRRPGQLLGSSLNVGNVVFDTESRQAFIDEKPQVLSARETAVLELLMRRKDRVVSKKLVEDQIFGLSGEVASNAVEVYVHRFVSNFPSTALGSSSIPYAVSDIFSPNPPPIGGAPGAERKAWRSSGATFIRSAIRPSARRPTLRVTMT